MLADSANYQPFRFPAFIAQNFFNAPSDVVYRPFVFKLAGRCQGIQSLPQFFLLLRVRRAFGVPKAALKHATDCFFFAVEFSVNGLRVSRTSELIDLYSFLSRERIARKQCPYPVGYVQCGNLFACAGRKDMGILFLGVRQVEARHYLH